MYFHLDTSRKSHTHTQQQQIKNKINIALQLR